jgi:putative ABC transport system permease protein
MLKNYLKLTWRNLFKNKAFSLINILGLTIGITVCLMIFVYLMNEFSVDRFHANEKNIYRLMRNMANSNNKAPYVSPPYATALKNDYPSEIKEAVRLTPTHGLIAFADKSFMEDKLYVTDDNFFKVFSFPLLRGDAATVLKDPGNMVITASTAIKYFGTVDNAMGKVVEMDKHLQLKVTGVAKDLPSNSHLDFNMVIPLSNFTAEPWFNGWMFNNGFTYLQLNDNISPASMEKRFPAFMEKYLGKDMEKIGARFSLSLTPLRDIYFEPSQSFDPSRHGDKKVAYIFLSIAVLILVIACINFVNLSTIRAAERSKEVGLRKVMGAIRLHLVAQFIGESILLTTISTILAVLLTNLLMPHYNQLLGYSLLVSWNAWPIYVFLGAVILIIGFLAGLYPAFFLSSFSPIQALKGKLNLGKSGAFFRQGLVVVQFSIAVLLIIGTIIIMNQMSYIKNKSLGYNDEQTLIIPLNNDDVYNNRILFKQTLEANNRIASVSLMSGEPGGFYDTHTFEAEGQTDPAVKFKTCFADFEMVQTLGLKIIAGRDFSAKFPTDTADAVLINRTAANELGFTPDKAVGKWIKNTIRDNKRRTVIGVVEDFNFLSLKEKIDPLVISPNDDRRVVLVKLKAGDMASSIAAVKSTFEKTAPVYPFTYRFLDQNFDKLYKKDLRQQTILGIFSGLAIFIACLGLFGLASFTVAKRTREISVRKVLGSSSQNILLLLTKDIMKPVLLATVIAIPLSYFAMDKWLQDFAYRTPLHWWIFLLAAVISLLIAFFTISYKALKVSMTNPAQSLRSE